MTSGSGPYCCISSKMMILSARGSGATDGNCQVSGYEHIPAPSKRLLLGTNFALQLSTSGPSSFWVTSHGFVVDELRRWWPANFQTEQTTEVWPFQTWTFCTPWEGEWTWFECIFFIAISRKSLASASQASLSASLMRACNCAEEGCIQSWLRKRWSCAVDWGCWIYGGHWKFEEIKKSRDSLSELHILQTNETSLAHHPITFPTLNPLVSFREKHFPGSPTWMVISMIFQG